MKPELITIAKSYDDSFKLIRKGKYSFDDLPDYIQNDPDYQKFKTAVQEGTFSDSARKEVKDFLSPTSEMKFIDLGCCLNLMFKGYADWVSLYHGVDISKEAIQLLNEFSAHKNVTVGSLFCGSIHETPFDDNYFDIGACIGVLEYFKSDFIKETLSEIHRITKPNARFVLDVPDIQNPIRRIMYLIEGHLGRPTEFNMSLLEFELALQPYFTIERKDHLDVALIQYFLIRK